MSKDKPNDRLSEDEAKALLKSIEDVEREEADGSTSSKSESKQ